MAREDAYRAIDSERAYQDLLWPNSKKISVLGDVTLVREYLRKFDKAYQEQSDAPGFDVPAECFHIIRKMAALLVRAMEKGMSPMRNLKL